MLTHAENKQLFNTSFYSSIQHVAPGFVLYMAFKLFI